MTPAVYFLNLSKFPIMGIYFFSSLKMIFFGLLVDLGVALSEVIVLVFWSKIAPFKTLGVKNCVLGNFFLIEGSG